MPANVSRASSSEPPIQTAPATATPAIRAALTNIKPSRLGAVISPKLCATRAAPSSFMYAIFGTPAAELTGALRLRPRVPPLRRDLIAAMRRPLKSVARARRMTRHGKRPAPARARSASCRAAYLFQAARAVPVLGRIENPNASRHDNPELDARFKQPSLPHPLHLLIAELDLRAARLLRPYLAAQS